MPESHPFMPLSDQVIYADYERHTAEAIYLLNGLSQGLRDKRLPER